MKLTTLALAFVASCSPAYAQERCLPTEQGYSLLTEQYKEQRLFIGNTGTALIEVWVNPETETWSLVETRPDGISCLAASGTGFEAIPIVTGDPA
jgi:hypothetical protein